MQPPGADPEIRGVRLDSRRVDQGDLFFALKGFRTDGERFVPQALERGAAAIVAASPRPESLSDDVAWVRVEDPRRVAGRLSRICYGKPDEAMVLVGITGTNGKTTVVFFLESIAAAAGRPVGRIGTVSNAIDGVEVPAALTTPEAPEFFALLAEMREQAIDVVAMEVSSHALELSRVDGAHFRVAAFLNLGRDHLDFHGDVESYFRAKARLFDDLGPDAVAVLPADDMYGRRLSEQTRAQVLTFGRSQSADVRLTEEHRSLRGSTAILTTPSGPVPIETSLLGSFNLDNVAAAAACAHAVGIPAEAITRGVRNLRGIPGRMEAVDCGQPFGVVVDYAHTEAALSLLLSAVTDLAEGRVLLVFGCGGGRDRGKRPAMGRAAAQGADLLFLTSDNPRNEDPLEILDDVRRGIAELPGAIERSKIEPERERAVRAAIAEARAGDVVILAGKGHETTQTVGNREIPLDDRELARQALAERGWGGDHADA
ncbi:hypothetical protein ABI59_12965 [Acidobacteria bacterium Mor1]|nr:hypothetical protein ABI59_12965 [Acidobacteria bacterium Mor1]